MYEVIDVVELPVEVAFPYAFLASGVVPFAVEPDIAGMVVVDEFADLGDHELLVRGIVALLVAQ